MKLLEPQDQVFWYLQKNGIHPLRESLETEIVIIGGGMAGIMAAQAFHKRGKRVILLEQYYCGSGASGKSSGFITPNCELSLTNFIDRFGNQKAKLIWDLIIRGSRLIRSNIEHYSLACDYFPSNSLLLANEKKVLKELRTEYENLTKLGYDSAYFEQEKMADYVSTHRYYGGIEYKNSFGIRSYAYCQEMKNILKKENVLIFEETPVLEVKSNSVKTHYSNIKADYIIVCADRFIPTLGMLKNQIFHVQNFLAMSQSLTDNQVKKIFPHEPYMIWDSDLQYTFYRMTTNNRLMIGGGTLLSSYVNEEYHHYQKIINQFQSYLQKTFPTVDIELRYIWPGLIGVSKDIAPLAGRDAQRPSIYYIACTAGLPIAATLGEYAAEHILEGRTDLDDFFSPYRSFFISDWMQKIIGKRASFALSNLRALY